MDTVQLIRSDLIDDPKMAMRTGMDRDKLDELADSIKKTGLINPITVRKIGERFEVVAGHRRLAACRIAGVVDIACVVKEISDEAVFDIMAQENLFREDVDPVDEAIFVGRLTNEKNMSVDDIAKAVNRSVQWVCDRLDILEYPENMLAAIRDGRLKLGVAKNLWQLTNDAIRKMYIDQAITYGMSGRQSEYILAQDKMGILVGEKVEVPNAEDLQPGEQPKARAICAKCGQVAIDPNLQMVFIHKECPNHE